MPEMPQFQMRWVPPSSHDTVIDHMGQGGNALLAPIAGHLDALHAPQHLIPSPALDEMSEVQRALRQLGHYEIEGSHQAELTVKEELLLYLRLAAEVEHALLVQYLYALASFAPGAANDHARDLVRTIALQEMAHLLTVQNLLMIVAGPDAIYFGRDAIRPTTPANPMPLSLEPISKLTLQQYALVESPVIPPEKLKALVLNMHKEVKEQTHRDPQRVGAVYARIYWLLQPSDEPSGPLPLRADLALGWKAGRHLAEFVAADSFKNYEATHTEWVGTGPDMLVLPAATRDEALTAVARVMAQGEGVTNSADSHFHKFLEILDAFEKGQLAIRPLPITPYVHEGPTDPGPRTQLVHPYVRAWAELLNVRYTMLIVIMSCAMGASRADNNGEDRTALLGNDVFHKVMGHVRWLVEYLVSAPLTSLGPSGPPFELVFDKLPTTAAARWSAFHTLLTREVSVIQAIKAVPDILVGDTTGRQFLDEVIASNDELAAFVSGHLPTPH